MGNVPDIERSADPKFIYEAIVLLATSTRTDE